MLIISCRAEGADSWAVLASVCPDVDQQSDLEEPYCEHRGGQP